VDVDIEVVEVVVLVVVLATSVVADVVLEFDTTVVVELSATEVAGAT
jgi:hypothetical protein